MPQLSKIKNPFNRLILAKLCNLTALPGQDLPIDPLGPGLREYNVRDAINIIE